MTKAGFIAFPFYGMAAVAAALVGWDWVAVGMVAAPAAVLLVVYVHVIWKADL